MRRFNAQMRKGDGGFTLVEIAMVLVVIALIIGAVLKGQDLIKNAQAKKFASFIRDAEIAQWTFLERYGRFAGDENRDGRIERRSWDREEPIAALQAEFPKFKDSITLGGTTFYVRFGYRRDTNEAILCVFKTDDDVDRNNPDHVFTEDDITMAGAFDVAVDGEAQARDGKVAGLRRNINVRRTAVENLADAKIMNRNYWVFGETVGRDTTGLLYYFDTGKEVYP